MKVTLRDSVAGGVEGIACSNRQLRFEQPAVYSSIMRRRQTTLSPMLRFFAATALLVWIAAQGLCFAHCNFGVGHGGSDKPSCHGAASPKSCHGTKDSSAPPQKSSPGSLICSTLKSALVGSGPEALVSPDLHLLCFLAPLAAADDAAVIAPASVSFRQAHSREWTFRPEVCLGPAFRGLAPPFVG